MSAAYQLTERTLASNAQTIIRESDGANIPPDPRNRDFQAYLAWLATSGNIPDPAAAVAPSVAAQTQYITAIAAGLTLTWSVSTALNGTYLIDQASQFNTIAEIVSINTNAAFTNGLYTKNWLDKSGAVHTFTVAQFKLFATTQAAYLDSLVGALGTASAGVQTTWPNSSVTINA